MDLLNSISKNNCECKKAHVHTIKKILIGNGVVKQLPSVLSDLSIKKPFIICNKNTFDVANKLVFELLENENINYSVFSFDNPNLKPNEEAVGSAIMNFKKDCDAVIGIGSGVINDVGKILANTTNLPYVIVATAPSMDGYASSTSSMCMGGLKVSLPSKTADVIIGDVDILKTAPDKMLVSGLGDMLAKYISIPEWQISHVITGEYYCKEIAKLVNKSLKNCMDNVDGLLSRKDEAVKSVFEGLVVCGIAMSYAGLSRPASGVEHYISHVLDMRNEEFNTPCSTHGIQCAIGTLFASKFYEQLKNLSIDKKKALDYVKNFDFDKYSKELIDFLGKGAYPMIEQEKKDKKYDCTLHEKRLKKITKNWKEILSIINSIPSPEFFESVLEKLSSPKDLKDIGIENSLLPLIFSATKDIRDKYVGSRLAFDLGIIEEIIF